MDKKHRIVDDPAETDAGKSSLFYRINLFFREPLSPSVSMLTLFLVNLFPVYGVLAWGWKVFPIMFLFWSENVIIGCYNILRIGFCKPEGHWAFRSKLIMIPFFTVHYGIFTLVHGLFVLSIFGQENRAVWGDPDLASAWSLVRQFNLQPAILLLVFSHGLSFLLNYIRKGEYRRVSLSYLMFRPYARVVVMHLTLIFGGVLILRFNAPVFGLLLFIGFKILIDMTAHAREHKKRH